LWENSALYVIPHLLVATALFLTFGFAGMLWCLYVPMLFIYNVTWAVNSICHMPRFGYRSFDTTDQSRNNYWIGVLGFGEGYHNNHHGQPRCAAHGLRWWEFDVTRYVIWLLEKCGLAWDVVWPAAEESKTLEVATGESPTPFMVSAQTATMFKARNQGSAQVVSQSR
jgi:fatty-acid desaturase